jgi:hypothetical protein
MALSSSLFDPAQGRCNDMDNKKKKSKKAKKKQKQKRDPPSIHHFRV